MTPEQFGEILGYGLSTVFYILVLTIPLFMFFNWRRPDRDISNLTYLIAAVLYFIAMPHNWGNFAGLVLGWLIFRQVVKFVKGRTTNG